MTSTNHNGSAGRLGIAVDGALSVTMFRRPSLGPPATAGAAGAAGAPTDIARVEPGGANVRELATTSDLLPRAQPSAVVLAAIPEGATVVDLGEGTNGYRKVGYDGAIGWILADDLA